MKKILKDFLKDDRGQSTTEYILILAVVVMVALRFKSMFQGQLDQMISTLDTQLNSAMQNNGS